MKKTIINNFKNIYRTKIEKVFFSPGRVNLIGEHLDYNGGLVLPTALSVGIYGAVGFSNDNNIFVYSEGFSEKPYSFSLGSIAKDEENSWADYIKGTFSIILEKGYQINQGLKLYLKSTVPTNAGLSSSSSLELLILTILNSLFNLKLTKTEMALIGQEIENKYIGVNSGIMDQYAIIHGKKDHAILLDTNKLEHRYIPLNLTGHKLIIINSNKKRSLTDSKYNQRFRESQQSLNLLKKHYNISALAQLKETDLLAIEKLNLGLLFKRIRHVVTEQERVLQSVEALESGEIEKFAKLMIASHNSLKNDYEVTGLELDALVNASLKAGALGARMTGAGFGGCIIVLVEEQKIESFTKEVANDYCKIVNLNPSFYYVETSDGTKEI